MTGEIPLNTMSETVPQDRFELLYRIGQSINSSLDQEVVFERLMDEIVAFSNAERGFILGLEESEAPDQNLALQCRAARNLEKQSIESEDFKVSRSIIREVLKDQEPQLTVDATSDERFSQSPSIELYGIRSVMCVPICHRSQLLGVIYVDSLAAKSAFDYDTLETLVAVANMAAMALENARLFSELRSEMMRNLVMKNYQWAILHSVESGILSVDHHYRVTTLNRAAGEILGLSSSQAKGSFLGQLLAPSASQQLLEAIRLVLEQRQSRRRQLLEFELEGRGHRHLDISVSPLREPGSSAVGATVIITDRTAELMAEQKRQQVQDLFGKLVSREVMEELVRQPVRALGGKRQRVTILLADINRFSSTCERLSPGQIITMLNRYFSAVNEVIFAHRGMIKQFAGDEVMVLFGAPAESDDHAAQAVLTAQGIVAKLQKLARSDPQESEGFYDVKIGIHTGDVVVGHVGSSERFEYAAVGDSVNLASRIMGLNKRLGTTVLMSEATAVEARAALPELRLQAEGLHKVRGRTQEVPIFSLL